MKINKFDCLDLAKLLSAYTKRGAPEVKDFPTFYAIYVRGLEVITVSKQGGDIRIKKEAKFNIPTIILINKSIEWLKFKQKYE